jgi:hypothetical protein
MGVGMMLGMMICLCCSENITAMKEERDNLVAQVRESADTDTKQPWPPTSFCITC